jgi:hypothetical protein
VSQGGEQQHVSIIEKLGISAVKRENATTLRQFNNICICKEYKAERFEGTNEQINPRLRKHPSQKFLCRCVVTLAADIPGSIVDFNILFLMDEWKI